MAAKKSPKSKDPMKDKSSAIRRVIKRMPTANVNEVVAAVKDEFGHKVNSDRILMVKTKRNMVTTRNQTNTQWIQLGASTGLIESFSKLIAAVQRHASQVSNKSEVAYVR